MIQTLEAVFDGEVLHPHEPMALEPNTRVRIVVETLREADAAPVSLNSIVHLQRAAWRGAESFIDIMKRGIGGGRNEPNT